VCNACPVDIPHRKIIRRTRNIYLRALNVVLCCCVLAITNKEEVEKEWQCLNANKQPMEPYITSSHKYRFLPWAHKIAMPKLTVELQKNSKNKMKSATQHYKDRQ